VFFYHIAHNLGQSRHPHEHQQMSSPLVRRDPPPFPPFVTPVHIATPAATPRAVTGIRAAKGAASAELNRV